MFPNWGVNIFRTKLAASALLGRFFIGVENLLEDIHVAFEPLVQPTRPRCNLYNIFTITLYKTNSVIWRKQLF